MDILFIIKILYKKKYFMEGKENSKHRSEMFVLFDSYRKSVN